MPVIHELLKDDYSFEEAEQLQIKYKTLIKRDSEIKYFTKIELIKLIAGLDISYFKKGDYEYGIACAVTWNLKKNEKVNHFFMEDHINFPYKPGFLGFRECKLLSKVISKLPNQPDLIMCDGHGIIHPRRFGEATQLGFALNIPSIGVAKNTFVGYSNWQKIERKKGNKTQIWEKNPKYLAKIQSNELIGYAVCLTDGKKPIFISEGYKIKLEHALKICLETNKDHRQPEPLYLAHHLSKKEINNYC